MSLLRTLLNSITGPATNRLAPLFAGQHTDMRDRDRDLSFGRDVIKLRQTLNIAAGDQDSTVSFKSRPCDICGRSVYTHNLWNVAFSSGSYSFDRRLCIRCTTLAEQKGCIVLRETCRVLRFTEKANRIGPGKIPETAA